MFRSLLLVACLATSAMAFSKASFYDLSAVKSDGSVLSMEECKGKVVYATNVASSKFCIWILECPYTDDTQSHNLSVSCFQNEERPAASMLK